MIFRPFLRFDTGCASYVLGCGGLGRCAVVDPCADDVDAYAAFASEKGMAVGLRPVSNAIVVDGRSPEELAAGHVEGAITIPLDALAGRAPTLRSDATVVTVSGKGGGRSERAAEQLRALGFGSVRSLRGGTQAWTQLGAEGA